MLNVKKNKISNIIFLYLLLILNTLKKKKHRRLLKH